MTIKVGDKVVYNETLCRVVKQDELNEEAWVITDGQEEITIDEHQIVRYDDYKAARVEEPVASKDEEDEVEDAVEEEVDEDEEYDADEELEEDEEVTAEADDEEVEEVEEEVDEDEEEIVSEMEDSQQLTAAGETIKAKPSAAMDPSKSQMMSDTISAMAGMSKTDMVDFFNKMIAQIGQEAQSIPGDAADKNQDSIDGKSPPDASVASKNITHEEVIELFGSEEISEEFKDKAAVLFESQLNLRVTEKVAAIKEDLEQKYEERIAEKADELTEKVDQYLTYSAKEWIEENKVEIENNLQLEFSKSMLRGLQQLFAEHYVEFPESEIDIVEALTERVSELETALNEQIDQNIELVEAIEGYNQEEVFDSVCEGLAMTQIEKFRTLTESIEFDGDEEAYKTKLLTIKEHHFKVNSKPSMLDEEVIEDGENNVNEDKDDEVTDPAIDRFAQAISRSVYKK